MVKVLARLLRAAAYRTTGLAQVLTTTSQQILVDLGNFSTGNSVSISDEIESLSTEPTIGTKVASICEIVKMFHSRTQAWPRRLLAQEVAAPSNINQTPHPIKYDLRHSPNPKCQQHIITLKSYHPSLAADEKHGRAAQDYTWVAPKVETRVERSCNCCLLEEVDLPM